MGSQHMSEIAVLIPTLGRAERLAGLVENVHAATEIPHTVYLIMESTDTESGLASGALDAVGVFGRFGSCAAAVNAGYRASTEPFVAVGNDDCLFHPGWDIAALGGMSETTHVVGLNDGSGDCKCFQLIRRRFIEEHSGVYDQPGILYHTYASQCCDTEFAHYAQLRGVWADAPDAVLEHQHWRFGKADPGHPNYVRARATNQEDLAEYRRRREQWDPKHLTPPCVPGGVSI
jgi:hypothetical protein